MRIWNAYRSRGMLMTARAHDLNTATIAQSMRGGKISDLLRVRPIEVEQPPVTAAQAMAILGGKIGKRKG